MFRAKRHRVGQTNDASRWFGEVEQRIGHDFAAVIAELGNLDQVVVDRQTITGDRAFTTFETILN